MSQQPETRPEFIRCLMEEALEAARRVATYDWGTSVSENYHFARIDAMDRLRAALGRLPGGWEGPS